MMRSLLRLVKPQSYRSVIQGESQTLPGVTYEIRRMSLGRRIELAEQIRGLGQSLEFHNAGDGLRDKIEASLLAHRIHAVYLRWGLVRISGLVLDGETPDADALIASGPEGLAHEIVARIKRECGLNDEERKN